jgi:hypothetical protein
MPLLFGRSLRFAELWAGAGVAGHDGAGRVKDALRGLKGAVGTQMDQLSLFDGELLLPPSGPVNGSFNGLHRKIHILTIRSKTVQGCNLLEITGV